LQVAEIPVAEIPVAGITATPTTVVAIPVAETGVAAETGAGAIGVAVATSAAATSSRQGILPIPALELFRPSAVPQSQLLRGGYSQQLRCQVGRSWVPAHKRITPTQAIHR
jgi:hypothetical protein